MNLNVFFAMLAVLFIGLKLTNVITWGWLWVLAPLWGPIALGLILFLVAASIAVVVK